MYEKLQILCSSGNGQALLGMPYIDMLNIININCNTIDTHRNDSTDNCGTNTAIPQRSRQVQHNRNMVQDADRAAKCCANIDSFSKFKNKDKPMIIGKEPNTIR